MVRILGAIFFIVLLFFIVSYTNSPDVPRLLSNAEETFLNLVGNSKNNENNDSSPPINLTLIRTIFSPGENIILQYDGDAQNSKDLSVDLKNSADRSVPIRATLSDDGFGKSLQIETSKKIAPGKYRLVIKQAQKDLINVDVYLGTIVINRQQSQYTTGENYVSDLIFFNDNGDLFCIDNSSFTLVNTISGGEDTIQTTQGKCGESPSPYHLLYTPKTTGTYILKSPTGKTSNTFIQESAFDVLGSAPSIVLKREGPTFVNSSGSYEVRITISANENFEGTVTDFAPAGFIITNSSNFSLQSSTSSFDGSTIHLRKPFNGDFPITLGFGETPSDKTIATDYQIYGVKAHDGIDFGLSDGTPVLAADDGKVIEFPTKLSAYGNTVILEHPWGGRTFYGHLSKVNVRTGQKVGKGDVIGLSGRTGIATGPHLHFGLDFKNSDVNNGYLGKIDPSPYLSDNNNLNASSQKLTWNVSINKGEKKELGYILKLPDDEYGYSYYQLGPINIVNKAGEVVFKDSKRWTLIKR